MQSLEHAMDYTKKKKQFQLEGSEERRLHTPVSELNTFLEDGSGLGAAAINLESMAIRQFWLFLNNYIHDGTIDLVKLSASTYLHLESANWRLFLAEKVPTFKRAPLLTDAVKHLGQLLYLGQYDKAKTYGALLLKMLRGKQYEGGLIFPTHPWFMLELYCRWQGIELDKAGLRYPDDLGLYQRALNNWDSEDTQRVSEIITELCDFHIAQSDEDVTTDEYGNEFSPEFTSSDYFIFPIEILMWLAIRKHKGLPVYTPAHPLMELSVNQLPDTPVPWEEDDLVNRCKTKLKADNPRIEFALG